MNEVHLRGRIVHVWTYGDDVFARLSVDRDTDRPVKGQGRDRYDYLSVRFLGRRVTGLALERGQDLEVHGYLQSRDYDEDLASWLEGARARGNVARPEISAEQGKAFAVARVTTEVIAERWTVSHNNHT